MPIAVLSQSTRRALVSTQVLLTPESIVKELVDNSLDAGATSIYVEIDDTTVNYLCVRDNGSGIRNGEDRDLMCLQHTTSKIQKFEDLHTARVETLGFRGEALASLAEIAGNLEITTRAKGDSVAERWSVRKDGSRLDTRHASQTHGTTVTAYALFQSIPVRKASYIKESRKTLTSISRLLRAIVMLRRGLRVTFKVRRPISVPSVFSGEKTLVLCVRACLGKDAVSQSEFIHEEFDDGWAIEAVLPKRDLTSVTLPKSSKRDFKQVVYAVDGRPLNTSLTTAKKLSKLTKQFLQSSARELVLCHISTPAGNPSYDVNIEPGKDDVLFYDDRNVLEKWTQILKRIYPEETSKPPSPPNCDAHTEEVVDDLESYVRWPRPLDSLNLQDQNCDVEIASFEGDHDIETVPDPVEYSNNNDDGEREDEVESKAEDEAEEDEEEDYRQDVNLHNPWVIAKLNRIQKPMTDSGALKSRHNGSSDPIPLITTPRDATDSPAVASWDHGDESPISLRPCGAVYMTPLASDNSLKSGSDTTATSPIKKSLRFTALSPSNTSLTQPSSPVEKSPTHPVQGRGNEQVVQCNSGLPTYRKKRSYLKMATLERFMDHPDESDSNDDAEEASTDAARRSRSSNLRSVNESRNENKRAKRHLPVQSCNVPLDYIPAGEETYPYLIRLGYNGTTDMTDILDSDASLFLLADIQEQLRSSLDPYWLQVEGDSLRCWDGANVKRLVLSVAENAEDDAELKQQIGRMDIFRGDNGWMVFA
ncbi:hypothetical protein V1525DRAFT_357589 [Lipomyces kononenkoae]|uniref:Uncharacterized protein n=1 Tax=Lipomyces kononenkoae TaxID=34357 RepID=A0ACC3T4Z2_LIPKO